MDATAVAQLVGGVPWSDVKAKCTGVLVIRNFNQLQRNTLETTTRTQIWAGFFGGQFPGYDSD
jgi:hypothetical protein